MTSALAILAILADLATATDLPPSVATLAAGQAAETFAVAGDTVVTTFPSASDPARSTMRFARTGAAPKEILLGGRALGLALTADGGTAYAVVRAVDRKGRIREVDLVPVDLESERASSGVRLPDTARGVSLARDGGSIFVVSRDEVRTFRLPDLTSGRLYRVQGENVGVRPLDDGRHAFVVQSAAVGVVDFAAPQTREGLALERLGDPPPGIRAVMLSTPDEAPVALTEEGGAWRLEVPAPAEQTVVAQDGFGAHLEPPPAANPSAEAAGVAAASAGVAAVVGSAPDTTPTTAPPGEAQRAVEAPTPDETAPAMAPAPSPEAVEQTESPPPPPPPLAPVEEPKAASAPRPELPSEPGTLTGSVDGAARSSVASIVVLGPDNILKEATRATPDSSGRYTLRGLAPGSYRLVAAGAGGRVLICDPPYITVRVSSSGAVEAPTLHALRAP